jgi:hypothetical protein
MSYSFEGEKTMAATQEDTYIQVQFCPCGCTYRLRKSKIIAMGGQQQLDDIESGKKLDVVIFGSEDCEQCKEDRRMSGLGMTIEDQRMFEKDMEHFVDLYEEKVREGR